MMISIGYLRFTDAVQRATFSIRQRAASVLARRALRNFAAVVPWKSVGTDAAMRESLWCEVEKLCNTAGRRFGVSGEKVEEACPFGGVAQGAHDPATKAATYRDTDDVCRHPQELGA